MVSFFLRPSTFLAWFPTVVLIPAELDVASMTKLLPKLFASKDLKVVKPIANGAGSSLNECFGLST
jgi:hypothetical protein